MISAPRAHLIVAATTHPGMKGKNNEDRYSVSAFYLNGDRKIPATLAIVCDGVGGHRAGEVAAEIAINTIRKTVAESDGSNPPETLREAIILASEAIRSQAEQNLAQKGMGATCVCAWIMGDQLFTVAVGDSRLYLVKDGDIRQLSKDHTWIQEALDHGALTPEQARGHPNAHVIRRYLGSQQPPEPDLRLYLYPGESDEQAIANQGYRLQAGDRLLLCSDGLTDLVGEQEILSALRTSVSREAVEGLQNLANRRGGHDNITLIALEAPPQGFAPASATVPVPAVELAPIDDAPTIATPVRTQPKRTRTLFGACLGFSLLLVAGLAFYGGLTWIMSRETPTPTAEATEIEIIFGTPTIRPSVTPSITRRGTESPLFPTRMPTTAAPLQFPPTSTPTPWPNTIFPVPTQRTRTPVFPQPGQP